MEGAESSPFLLQVGGVTDVGENTGESAHKQLNKSIVLILSALFV